MASRALVIGPSAYARDSGIEDHRTIAASAALYGEVLARDELWGPGSCRVLGSDEVETVGGVMRALQETAAATKPQDILLVVYVGHGQYWQDLRDDQVHFSVGSSYRSQPWTWLSSCYVYHVMRKSPAKLKVLIADCCYSSLLPQLGEEQVLPGAIGRREEGTCVFTAGKSMHSVSAEACPELPGPMARCTPFSGHLLNILARGTLNHNSRLTIGMLREAVKNEMEGCGTDHQTPRMSLNDASEGTALFINRMEPHRRPPAPSLPDRPEEWVEQLRQDRESHLPELLKDECRTGDVVALLSRDRDAESQRLARYISDRANTAFSSPQAFARYFVRMERALRA